MKIIILLCILFLKTTMLTSIPNFEVDYENDQFLMNGKPFRYISGSFHYFRALPETWRTKLRTMRAAGLNAVSTYVEWSLHNPKDGEYNWEGIANLTQFIQLAKDEDLYVILRPGPYICAERDMGGLPYWLLNKYPEIQLRTSDLLYLNEISIWYSELMPRIKPHLFGNGGPIIMVQIENEYGYYYACDNRYKKWLRDETLRYTKNKAVLFTTDGFSGIHCGVIDGVFATIDFGTERKYNTSFIIGDTPAIFEINTSMQLFENWYKLREFQTRGPLVNSEFYSGWITHWQEDYETVESKSLVEMLKLMLDEGASVNFYMFYGGTNFGFTSGANIDIPDKFTTVETSYDYNAPMDEAGDPTPKYMEIREVIGKYIPLPNITVPEKSPKMKLELFSLRPITTLLSNEGTKYLASPTINSTRPVTFEYLNQNHGFVLYEISISRSKEESTTLTVEKLRDRAQIYINKNFVGILSREDQVYTLQVNLTTNWNEVQILVENQGRVNFIISNDFKGILGDVRLGNNILYDWRITGFPLENYENIENLIKEKISTVDQVIPTNDLLKTSPTIFYGEFDIPNENIYDTYLDTTGWGKGVAFVNGFNLGRYWPIVGPQITLYVPKEILLQGINKIVLIENQIAANECIIEFTDTFNIDFRL